MVSIDQLKTEKNHFRFDPTDSIIARKIYDRTPIQSNAQLSEVRAVIRTQAVLPNCAES